MSRKLVGFVLLVAIFLSGCMPPSQDLTPSLFPVATIIPASDTPTPTATIPPTATITRTPPPPTATPSVTPTPTATPPESITGWSLVYKPVDPQRSVATVHWSANGRELIYALSPSLGGYLLDWFSYNTASQKTQPLRSPNYGFANFWHGAQVGYPKTVDPFSEILGFVSPEFTKGLYPNAGFPNTFTNPNFIFLTTADGKSKQKILGPIFRGTVGRGAWIDFETRVIFDYRYTGRVVVYLADLIKGRTETLAELPGDEIEWRVSPDEKYLLLPRDGLSELMPLHGNDPLSLETNGGMARPEWTQNSRAINFWSGDENRILSYTLADQMIHPIVVRRDLEPFSPIPPVYGMPFSISPDGSKIAFWLKNWIWIVELAGTS